MTGEVYVVEWDLYRDAHTVVGAASTPEKAREIAAASARLGPYPATQPLAWTRDNAHPDEEYAEIDDTETYRITRHTLDAVPGGDPERCPDAGTCHHACATGCFRVENCGPLTGVYPGDQWPPDVVAEHTPATGYRL